MTGRITKYLVCRRAAPYMYATQTCPRDRKQSINRDLHYRQTRLETHCNTLQPTATHCNTPQHAATHCAMCSSRQLQERGLETHCNTPQPRNTPQHAATRRATCSYRQRGPEIQIFVANLKIL